jgi:hypothetical protein
VRFTHTVVDAHASRPEPDVAVVTIAVVGFEAITSGLSFFHSEPRRMGEGREQPESNGP